MMTDTDPEKEPRGVQAVETGFALLRLIAGAGTLGVADLRAGSGLGRAQVHAYLASFLDAGLVEKDPASGLYRIGATGLALGMAQLLRQDPQQIAVEEAEHTARATGQTIAIAVWGRYGPTVTASLQANDRVRNAARPGTVYSVTGTATGLLFAALLPEDATAPVIAAQRAEATPHRYTGRCTTLAQVRPQIELARQHDLAATYSWPMAGISALAAPVRNFSDQLEMALTLIGGDAEIDTDPDGPHARALRALAARVSARLGHVPSRG